MQKYTSNHLLHPNFNSWCNIPDTKSLYYNICDYLNKIKQYQKESAFNNYTKGNYVKFITKLFRIIFPFFRKKKEKNVFINKLNSIKYKIKNSYKYPKSGGDATKEFHSFIKEQNSLPIKNPHKKNSVKSSINTLLSCTQIRRTKFYDFSDKKNFLIASKHLLQDMLMTNAQTFLQGNPDTAEQIVKDNFIRVKKLLNDTLTYLPANGYRIPPNHYTAIFTARMKITHMTFEEAIRNDNDSLKKIEACLEACYSIFEAFIYARDSDKKEIFSRELAIELWKRLTSQQESADIKNK